MALIPIETPGTTFVADLIHLLRQLSYSEIRIGFRISVRYESRELIPREKSVPCGTAPTRSNAIIERSKNASLEGPGLH